MIIGGQAVLVHGESRFTNDIDVTLGVGPDRLLDVMTVARKNDWQILPENPESFVEKTMVLPCRDNDTGMRIDLVFSFTPYERNAIDRAITVRVDDSDVSIASVEDLVIHKIVAGRSRDIDDVRSVILKNPASDWGYVRRWLNAFEDTVDRELVQEFEKLLDECTSD